MLARSVLHIFTTLLDCIVFHQTSHPSTGCVDINLEYSCHIVYRELIRQLILLLNSAVAVASIGRCVAKLIVEVLLGQRAEVVALAGELDVHDQLC